MARNENQIKAGLIAFTIAAILCLNYFTLPQKTYLHAVYRILFYLPLILGGLWFGMRGALLVCGAVLFLFLPYFLIHWNGLTLGNFDELLEGLLFVITAIILGLLVERQRHEQKARVEAERLAAVGKAVSEIAHDMKTPLMAIGGFAGQVARNLEADDPKRRKLAIVVQETQRLESMVREMLDFGKPLALQRSRRNLNDVVLDSVETTMPLARKSGVELEPRLEPSLPEIPLDAPRMKQVLLNLLSNAIQASPPRELVRITTAATKNSVRVEVADNGEGINEEHRENLFRPFFTTKKEGTGLGLPIVKKIVEAHGGVVTFQPNKGKGVTFIVSLPL
jgi:two-component system sensor histidine kinase HydH